MHHDEPVSCSERAETDLRRPSPRVGSRELDGLNPAVESCLAVFYLTATVATMMAVHQESSPVRLAGIALACAMLLALRTTRSGVLVWVVLLSVLLNIAYLVNRDWWMREGWIAVVTPLYRTLSGLHAPVELVSTASADGAMLTLVPLQIAAVRVRRMEGRTVWPWAANAVATIGLLLVGASKGTLLLLLPAIVAGMVRLSRRVSVKTRRTVMLGGLLVVGGSGILAASSIARIASVERPWLVASFDLARDFWLTGMGAGDFSQTFSLYRAVLPTPYLVHAQNLYLDVWLAHGLAGLTAFVGLCVAALIAALRALRIEEGVDSIWRTAAFGSLVILLLHGIYDDPYYDGGHLFPVLGLVFGVAMRRPVALQAEPGAAQSRRKRSWRRMALFLAPLTLGLFPVVQAAAAANVGALVQSHIEMRALKDAPANDAARRASLADAAVAETAYRYAIELDPHNGTALLRLGQIALLRREYAAARNYLDAALRVNPHGRAERLLLGETFWRQGDVVTARALWEGVRFWELSIEARRSQE